MTSHPHLRLFAALALAGGACVAAPFPVRGYHQHLYPDRQPMTVVHQRLETLKAHGYNMAVFGMGSPGKSTITMQADGSIRPNGCAREEMAALVSHAIELGLEPVFEMKFIGKQLKLLEGMVGKHPDLVIDPSKPSTVLNAAFRFPDGRDAYAATSLALVDYLLALYPPDHPARYFFLGIDEFSGDDMAALAKKMGMAPARAFAHCVDLGVEHLLARGITPMVWGDTLLSPVLGTQDHGITLPGYTPDPRLTLQAGGAYHAVFANNKEQGLHTAVNHLRHREKMIVVDWHYGPSPTGEFPSVDYFQRVGFKDVWGAPWHNATNLRQFTRYAAKRKCGGMIATAWYDAHRPHSVTIDFIIGSSAALFHDPSADPPAAGPASFTLQCGRSQSGDDEKRCGWVRRDDRTAEFTVRVTEPVRAREGRLVIAPVGGAGETVDLPLQPRGDRVLHAPVTLPVWPVGQQCRVQYCYIDEATGWVYLKRDDQGFVVTDAEPNVPPLEDDRVLVYGDFSSFQRNAATWLGGRCAGPLGWAARSEARGSQPRGGGLDMQWIDRAWVLPSPYLNQTICRGFHLHVEARMTGGFSGNSYCALLTKGGFNNGFRLLVGGDRHLLFQAAQQSGGMLWLRSPKQTMPLNEWTRIDVDYAPPTGDGPGRASIAINGKRTASASVPSPLPVSAAVIGIGCEFSTPTVGPTGKKRPNFPGLIRAVTLREAGDSK